MSEIAVLIVLYAVGVLLLLMDIFIPSHGILALTGVGFLVAAVAKTFGYAGREAGIIAILACLVFLPTFACVAIKYWRRTPIGRRISPPNPVLTSADMGVPVEELSRLVGQTGSAVTPLRPVGICEFNGKRISCVAQFGMVERGSIVEAVGVSGCNLAVQKRLT